MSWIFFTFGLAAAVPAALRFLRVAQREHYLAGSTMRFGVRWWTGTGAANLILAVTGIGGLAASPWWEPLVLLPIASTVFGPLGLTIKGVTAPLHWTGRLRRLAGIVGFGAVVIVAVGFLVDGMAISGAVVALLMPLLIDLGLVVAAPVEARMGQTWIDRARARLTEVAPRVVAITGSYGKTTTKEYLRILLSGGRQTVVTPASFNNAMGLARTINEHLTPGTDVFVAEMGTYGPGEIASLCSWIPPEVAVITAIGPVHLERFGTLERTLEAKSEILEGSAVAVLNVDDERLADLADRQPDGRKVVRCSASDTGADVCVLDGPEGQEVWVGGNRVSLLDPPVAFPSNVACAIGAALEMGLAPASIGGPLSGADRPAHRQTLSTSDLGFTIIDDTYNSNPAGAAAGLRLLSELGSGARRVLVTPGMVELGATQGAANALMAANAAGIATDILIVGRTNRRSLLSGAGEGPASVIVVESRPQAVEWVRANLGRGDVVLYENDLPDHYP